MTRFRPSRAGLINIWDYVDEEFVFADGRLVLRGHNGSGKTKALEVLFPFILDGVADARRLDPFSGDNRTMKSNLLYRGQESEYGFVWMEFSAGDRTVTLIVALRARKDKPAATTSFFVTRQRIGVDFGLLSADSRPLTERQLEQILGADACFDTATAYRDAIDTALFGLGRQRYTQLLDLLLALRRPLLAKDLDPAKVSQTLTAGLSPVSDDLVDQAARDFENLAAVQRLVEDLSAADAAARAFSEVYRDYLRMDGRAHLGKVDERTRQAVGHATSLYEASVEMGRAGLAEQEALAAREAAAQRKTKLGGTLNGLKQTDAYTSQHRLTTLREQVTTGKRDLDGRRAAHAKSAQHLTALDREAEDVSDQLLQHRLASAAEAAAQAQAARSAGIEDSDTDLQTAKARVTARRDDIDQVRARLSDLSARTDKQGRATDALETADTKLDHATGACKGAEDGVTEARDLAQRRLEEWKSQWAADRPDTDPVIADSDVAALIQALTGVAGPDAASLPSIFADLTEERRAELLREQTRLTIEREGHSAERERLSAERDKIASEQDEAPAPAGARTSDRSERPGAPLWELVRFTDEVSPAEAAALEAALDAAGLLTAWIHPDPALTATAFTGADTDAYLYPLPPEGRPTGPSLTTVLVPEVQDRVPEPIITDVLACIALADTLLPTSPAPAISTLGQFTFGIQIGACAKDAPEYIGATYRAARRASRIADHDQLIGVLTGTLGRLDRRLEHIDTRLTDLGQAREQLPPIAPILAALTDVASTSALLAAARTERADAAKALDTATAETDAARRRLRQTAAERDLPAQAGPVDLIAHAIDEYLARAERLHGEQSKIAELDSEVGRRAAMIEELREDHAEVAAQLEERAETQLELAEELSALDDTLSAPLQEVLGKIERTEADLIQAGRDWSAADQRVDTEHDALVTAKSAHEHRGQALQDAVAALLEATQPIAAFTDPDLRPLLGLPAGLTWPHPSQWAEPGQATQHVIQRLAADQSGCRPEQAVLAIIPSDAGQLLRLLDTATHGQSAAEGARKAIRQRLSDALKDFSDALTTRDQDYRLDWQPGDAVITVHVYDADGRHPVAEFARRISDQADEQRFLLEERERTVLEDELLTTLAQQIFDLVYLARDLVKGMDADTRSRPMSNGITVGIRWVTSDKITDLQRDVSALLSYEKLGPEQLTQLRHLLRQMLREHRAAHPRDTYREALSATLDYRSWHAFELRLKVPGQEEVKLSRKQHSLMSGGEKSAAIHLPLFAAANAIYSSASPDCPRMIALDEAFAGIDDRYKPDLLGLTVQYGLDAFMTGHDLWVRYDTVPAAAHYDMHSDKLSHTVSAMLILWDGSELVDAGAGFSGNEELAAEILGFTPTRHAPTDDGLLALQTTEQEASA